MVITMDNYPLLAGTFPERKCLKLLNKNTLPMRYIILIILFYKATGMLEGQKVPFIDFDADKVTITSDDTTATLELYRGHLDHTEMILDTPVIGEISRKNGIIVFTPVQKLSQGNRYTLRWLEQNYYFQVGIPDNYSYLDVVAVFPSANEVPANIARWYLQLNKSIDVTNFSEACILNNSKGDTLNAAIRPLKYYSQNEHILLVEVEKNYSFVQGQDHQLILSGRLRDKNGIAMGKDWVYTFDVIKPKTTLPDASDWRISSPQKTTREALSIVCGESMDFRSLIEGVNIINSDNQILQGKWTSGTEEKSFSFKPNIPWQKGLYNIKVYNTVVDIADNQLTSFSNNEEVDAYIILNFQVD
jgi:hypothetical protein